MLSTHVGMSASTTFKGLQTQVARRVAHLHLNDSAVWQGTSSVSTSIPATTHFSPRTHDPASGPSIEYERLTAQDGEWASGKHPSARKVDRQR